MLKVAWLNSYCEIIKQLMDDYPIVPRIKCKNNQKIVLQMHVIFK
jgi:hypothetical protein